MQQIEEWVSVAGEAVADHPQAEGEVEDSELLASGDSPHKLESSLEVVVRMSIRS
jgi:hypothetical protein